ncbi:general odorant-binding protein 56a [Diachasma alloeum]|uniref:general odorant-binding protein 56a n=1 Tax=Diachasma alloeum TaxID=454923 RepID=UPI00073843AB|nr:general odorant-binding protein 56a [Diachasma alloeum]
MKSGVFFVALVGAFAVVAGDPPNKDCPLMKALKESIDACIDKLSEESAKLMEKDQFADNEEIRCFHACVMTHSGLMTDGKMDIAALEEMLSGDPEHEEEARKITEIMKSCKPESETSDNECEVAGNYVKCFQAKKMN